MDELRVLINGQVVSVPPGALVAAAIARAGLGHVRRSPTGQPRAPLCGMGICYECRVTIDGAAHQLSCQVLCVEGMQVVTE